MSLQVCAGGEALRNQTEAPPHSHVSRAALLGGRVGRTLPRVLEAAGVARCMEPIRSQLPRHSLQLFWDPGGKGTTAGDTSHPKVRRSQAGRHCQKLLSVPVFLGFRVAE